MGATIYFRNAKIVVPVAELAETLHQLTIAEETLGAYARSNGSSAHQGPAHDPQPSQATKSVRALALEFLKLIQDFRRSGGAPQAEVMRVLGAGHPKGIGSKAALVNRALIYAGFKIEEVYSNDREPSGSRSWKAREELDRAIEVLSSTNGPVESGDNQETLI